MGLGSNFPPHHSPKRKHQAQQSKEWGMVALCHFSGCWLSTECAVIIIHSVVSSCSCCSSQWEGVERWQLPGTCRVFLVKTQKLCCLINFHLVQCKMHCVNPRAITKCAKSKHLLSIWCILSLASLTSMSASFTDFFPAFVDALQPPVERWNSSTERTQTQGGR